MPTYRDYLLQTVKLAKAAQKADNLPIGAVIVLGDKIIAEGQNRLWSPITNPGLHAEIDALKQVDHTLWARAPEMTLYTSLEPCLMCFSTIILHRIGHIIYGANDPWGGGLCSIGHLPPAFDRLHKEIRITGPALPEECEPLFQQITEILEQKRANRK